MNLFRDGTVGLLATLLLPGKGRLEVVFVLKLFKVAFKTITCCLVVMFQESGSFLTFVFNMGALAHLKHGGSI